MDTILCDELLQEILGRLPPAAAASVSLVSKRWLSLLRSSTSSLRVRVPSPASAQTSSTATDVSLSSILAHYPFLSDLTVSTDAAATDSYPPWPSSDDLVALVAAAPCAARLARLRLAPDSPLSSAALLSCAPSFPRLAYLQVTSLSHRSLSLRWLAALPSLKSLSLLFSRPKSSEQLCEFERVDIEDDDDRVIAALPLERLSLAGIRSADVGFSWLWRRCGNLRWLQLRACEGTGDRDSSEGGSFAHCLHEGLLGLELRTCRTIADRVLFRAADRCHGLASLLLYDGGSRDALSYFIHRRGAFLRTLDLRLPLDLHNGHLLGIAAAEDDPHNHGGGHGNLVALRLQSCCLVTGDGLRSLVKAPAGAAIEELALVNCDVVEREPGLLTFLSQSMHRLRRLDLSHNEMLTDKEAGAMLASCKNLVEIRLRGCRALTGAFVASLLKYCGGRIEVVDLVRCPWISADAVETIAANASRLSHIMVEDNKVTEAARTWLSKRAVRIDLICNPSVEQ